MIVRIARGETSCAAGPATTRGKRRTRSDATGSSWVPTRREIRATGSSGTRPAATNSASCAPKCRPATSPAAVAAPLDDREERDARRKGDFLIDEDQAAIVRRIFRDYAAGVSPRTIAAQLNAEYIPAPRGRGDGRATGSRTRSTATRRAAPAS
ncbi:recombinase family protein [Cereibacter sphaeroides]|uniref:recombinase family protein n=1 Tax=Cereibacter sphaeroides TaxID=1063 RepID=UPI000E5ABBC2|nr:recombinase family protein [Cereibacter sphaeroides]RHZ92316.1 hypothetical protein D1122_19880 [Cereibacter sphaeroides]